MPKVATSVQLPVSAQTVWSVIGNFNGLPDWHPAVEKSETTQDSGEKVRTLFLRGGGQIVEKQLSSDDKERVYSYSILSGPLPVANYTAVLKVREAGGGCTVDWSSEFEASGAPENDAIAAISGVYEAGFENLKKMFGG